MAEVASSSTPIMSRAAARLVLSASLIAAVLGCTSLTRDEWTPPSGEVRQAAGLHVRSLGHGARTILFLHGLAGSNRYFGGAFDALARDARVIAPDLLGFGDSPRPAGADYGPDAHAAAVLAVLDELHTEDPIYIVAHSAGTIVAFRIAALRPDIVRGVLAFGPPIYRSEADARAHISQLGRVVRTFAMDTLLAKLACHTLRAFPDLAARLATGVRGDLPPPIAADAVKHSWASYSGTMRNLILLPQPPGDLDALRIPMRWIVGAEDKVIDMDFLKELAQGRESIQMEVWPGGHDLPLTAARMAMTAIREMMDRR